MSILKLRSFEYEKHLAQAKADWVLNLELGNLEFCNGLTNQNIVVCDHFSKGDWILSVQSMSEGDLWR